MIRAGRPLRLPKLDARLQAIADQVPTGCSLAADIGADHGRLSCHLLAQGICQRMIVSDISPAALQKARRLLHLHGLEGRARFVVADGLDALEEPVEAIIISGLGGNSIADILQRGSARLGDRLLLSPHTHGALVRQAIQHVGYHIDREVVARAAGRYYTVMVALPGSCPADARSLAIGRHWQASASATVSGYLAWRLQVVLARRRGQTQQEIEWLREEMAHAKGNESDGL